MYYANRYEISKTFLELDPGFVEQSILCLLPLTNGNQNMEGHSDCGLS